MSEAPLPELPMLGRDAGIIDANDRDEVARLSLAMAMQCRRYLDIVSRHLDPALYDNDEFCGAIKQFVLGNRRARVRLLIIDARPLITAGHRLIDLANRLPSYLEIRAPAHQHRGFNEAFMVADNEAYILRQFSDRYEAQVDFADRRIAATLGDRFDNMWERGTPETRFRRLHL